MDEDHPPPDIGFRCWFCSAASPPVPAVGFLRKPEDYDDLLDDGDKTPLREALRPACQEHMNGGRPFERKRYRDNSLTLWKRVPFDEGKRMLWTDFCKRAIQGILES